jgi:hypothetical protein
MSSDNSKLESLIAGGLIGAALGSLLSKDKEDGAFIGAILGAAFSATLKANEEAQKTNVPVYVVEEGKLYAIEPGGVKRLIRKLKKSTAKYPNRVKLK